MSSRAQSIPRKPRHLPPPQPVSIASTASSAKAPRALASIHRAEPTGREVSFGVDELLVTKTDLNGRITYANQSFLRIAAYTESELVGQAHSVIRHPEMPRCVFHLLWSAIQSGKETFAYVVNLTKEGDHYWVFAHVTPTFDHKGSIIGYHSNRRAPDKEQVVRVKQVYDRLLAAERGFERNTDAIAASSKVLESLLAEQKKSYDEFVFSI